MLSKQLQVWFDFIDSCSLLNKTQECVKHSQQSQCFLKNFFKVQYCLICSYRNIPGPAFFLFLLSFKVSSQLIFGTTLTQIEIIIASVLFTEDALASIVDRMQHGSECGKALNKNKLKCPHTLLIFLKKVTFL